MKVRATVLTIVVVLSMMAADASGALGAPVANGPEDVRTPAFEPGEAANNSTDDGYTPIEPSQNYTDKSVDLDSFTSEKSAGISAADASSSSIIMDPNDSDPALVGTTKQYLGSDNDQYYFKDFTLLALGDNVEVWVAQDLAWPDGDSREDPTISEQQAESMATQFDENMYPVESAVFGTPDTRNGSNAQLSELGVVPEDYYKTGNDSDRTVLLVDTFATRTTTTRAIRCTSRASTRRRSRITPTVTPSPSMPSTGTRSTRPTARRATRERWLTSINTSSTATSTATRRAGSTRGCPTTRRSSPDTASRRATSLRTRSYRSRPP